VPPVFLEMDRGAGRVHQPRFAARKRPIRARPSRMRSIEEA
jgi:hypothetical protein